MRDCLMPGYKFGKYASWSGGFWLTLAAVASVLPLAAAAPVAKEMPKPMLAATDRPRFAVVPPGPVSDRTRVELRLAIPNASTTPRSVTVEFFARRDKVDHLISSQTVNTPAESFGFARAWWKTEGKAGKHRLRYRVKDGKRMQSGEWPLEVISSSTPALPRLLAGWLDPLGLDPAVYPRNRPSTAQDVRDTVRGMKRLGMSMVIITYVEYQGYFFYPSTLRFYDRDLKRKAAGQKFSFDVVGEVLAEAERQRMHVILGLGRAGDTPLLWEFDRPDWAERNRQSIDIACRVAQELWQQYGKRRSFYGWYLTHEMNDLVRASAYYDPVARYCRALSPEKPVLAAPAGTPIMSREILARSEIDIFAYQDAVGSGYVPYKNTFQPEQRIAMLPEVYRRYRELHAGTDKHLWSDLELWEMDGSAGYGKAYPPPFSRVRKQMEVEAPLVEMLTGYEIFGFLQLQGEGWKLKDPRATALARDYRSYLQQLSGEGSLAPRRARKTRSGTGEGSVKASTSTVDLRELRALRGAISEANAQQRPSLQVGTQDRPAGMAAWGRLPLPVARATSPHSR
jgi:hypothetical protein